MFVREGCFEVSFGLITLFNGANESMEPLESANFVGIANPGGVERGSKNSNGFVVCLERNGKWVAVLAAQSKTESRRIGKTRRCAVNDFGNQRQGLQSSRSKLFKQQKFREIVEIPFVSDGEHGTEPL